MIAIIGAGAWGSALAHAFAAAGKAVALCPLRERASSAQPSVPGASFVDIEAAKRARYLVFALSSASTAAYLAEHFLREKSAEQKVLIATKGLHKGAFMSEVFAPYFEQIAILSGPSFAAEVRRNLPTAVVISSASEPLAAEFAGLFPPFIKPYTSTDLIGTQIAGAYKNIIAIASGISDALELGNNARAALLSRGLVEMARFGKHFGAQEATFLGLCGAGDLFLTASSTLSRNYRAGAMLAAKKPPEAIAAELGEVAEGIITAQQIASLAASAQIHAPIAAQIAAIIAGKDIQTALNDLLKR